MSSTVTTNPNTPTVNAALPPIPVPLADVNSLYRTCVALRQATLMVAGSLGLNRAATLNDLSGLSINAAALTNLLDAAFGVAEGLTLQRGASAWQALDPGTAGQVLTSGGPLALNSWADISASLDLIFGSTEGQILQRGPTAWQVLAPGTVHQVLQSGGASALNSWAGLSALLDAVFGSTEGHILQRGASVWQVLAPGAAGQVLTSGGPSALNSWAAVTPTLSSIAASIGSDVGLSNTGNYFDGPSVAQGAIGSWLATGTVTVADTAGAASFLAKLWDGTTVIASAAHESTAANQATSIALSGIATNPAGNLRISVRDVSATTGKMLANLSGSGKDSTLSAVRIG